MPANTSVINVAILGDSKKFRGAIDKADSRLKKFSKAAALGFAGVVPLAQNGIRHWPQRRVDGNIIIAGTGASGAALDGLIDSARQLQPGSAIVRRGLQALADVNTNWADRRCPKSKPSCSWTSRVAGVDVLKRSRSLTRRLPCSAKTTLTKPSVTCSVLLRPLAGQWTSCSQASNASGPCSPTWGSASKKQPP